MTRTMKKLSGLGLFLALLPLSVFAAPVTLDFTGVVTSTYNEPGIAVGTAFSGTMTFDYANSTATTGTVGSTSGALWQGLTADPANPVFSMTATIGSTLFTVQPSASVTYNSPTQNYVNGSGGTSFYAVNVLAQSVVTYLQAQVSLSNPSGGLYDLSGLPLLPSSGTTQNNFFATETTGVHFDITSLTPAPVPLPAAGWLLVSGLGAMGAMVRRRRTAVA